MTQSVSLYQLEEHLAALIDTVELVEPDQEKEFAAEFQLALRNTIEKRDRVGQFLAHLDSQIALADAEVKRLRDRKASMEKVSERVEGYVQRTIESFGMDDSGRYRKLEGNTITFSLKACPPSVSITDEDAVPNEYKCYTIKMPAALWEKIKAQLNPAMEAEIQQQVKLESVTISKKDVKTAIDQGWDVAGADIAIGNYSLRRD